MPTRLAVALCLFALLGVLACQGGSEEVGEEATDSVVLVFSGQEVSFSPGRTIMIATDGTGAIRCDGKAVEDLSDAVAGRARDAEGPRAVLDLDPQTSCERIETILADVRKGGVSFVAFVHDLARDNAGFPLVLPRHGASPFEIESSQAIIVALAEDGEIRVDGESIEAAELAARMRSRLAENDAAVVCVEPEASTAYARLFPTLMALSEAGAARVSLWGKNSGVLISSGTESEESI